MKTQTQTQTLKYIRHNNYLCSISTFSINGKLDFYTMKIKPICRQNIWQELGLGEIK